MAKYYRGTLAILKKGIQTFIEKTLQDQHAKLCDDAVDKTEYIRECRRCDKNNLLPKHSKEFCPSQKHCLCRRKSKGRRPCPNKVCDSLLEGIIQAHGTLSPNLKNTNISRWSEDFWEVAKCFMAHNSESVDKADFMDLLHIMANDKLIRKKLGLPESEMYENTDDYLNTTIQACKTIRRQKQINPQTFVEAYHECMMRLLKAVGDEYAQNSAIQLEEVLRIIKQTNAGFFFGGSGDILQKLGEEGKDNYPKSKVNLVLKSKTQTEVEATGTEEFYFQLTPEDFMGRLKKISEQHLALANRVFVDTENGIYLDFVQSAYILIQPEKVRDMYANESLVETSVVEEIVGKTHDGNASNDVFVVYLANDEKDWFIDNLLRWRFHFNDKSSTSTPSFQEVLILTLQFAKKLGISVQVLCRKSLKALETQEKSTVVITDLLHESIENNLFENIVKKHKLVKLIHKSQFEKYRENAKTVLMIGGIKELVVSDSLGVYRPKNSKSIKHCLYRCFRKIGPRTLEKLTFKNLVFDEDKTKVYVPFINCLKTIKLKESKLVPVANFVKHLEIENVLFTKSEAVTLYDNMRGLHSVSFIGQTKYILGNIIKMLVWPSCPQLENISTSIITLGNGKHVTLGIQRTDFDKNCSAYFGKSSTLCTANELSCMIHHAVNKQMLDKFTRVDVEMAECPVEKQFILNAICYSLLQKHESYVDVYPAKYENLEEIVLVCMTKDNRFLSHNSRCEDTMSSYVGFKTIERSIYAFSAKASYCPAVDFEKAIENYQEVHFQDVNEIVAFHAENLLNEHRNLVAVAVSLGKDTNDGVDVTLGPHIVLYVKAKSYIPFNGQPFPNELVHEKFINIKYPVDVREGYYVSSADAASNLRANDRLHTLAMGCSIGGENMKTGGTMGPLVEYKLPGLENRPSLGFLTTCHLFRKPEDSYRALGTIVVQPADVDETGLITPNKTCGKVVACKFDEEVDAALVQINSRAPTMARFITPTIGDLEEAGFSRNNGMPKYQYGRSLHVSDLTVGNGNARRMIVKYGKMTGLKKGMLSLACSAVRLQDTLLPGACPVSMPLRVHFSHKLLRQMMVMSAPEISFFQKGDSGCGVFLVGNENQLWCIGMGVGMLSDSMCVVTPIHTVLDGLRSCPGIGDELRLKSFEADEMDDE